MTNTHFHAVTQPCTYPLCFLFLISPVQKLQERQATLKKCTLPERQKEKWSKVIISDVMSSEESEANDETIIIKPGTKGDRVFPEHRHTGGGGKDYTGQTPTETTCDKLCCVLAPQACCHCTKLSIHIYCCRYPLSFIYRPLCTRINYILATYNYASYSIYMVHVCFVNQPLTCACFGFGVLVVMSHYFLS